MVTDEEITQSFRTTMATNEEVLKIILDDLKKASSFQEIYQAAAIANFKLKQLGIFDEVSLTLDGGPTELQGTTNVVVQVVESKSPLSGQLGFYTKLGAKSWSLEGKLNLKHLFGYADLWDGSTSYGWDQTTEISAGVALPRISRWASPVFARASLLSQDWQTFSSYKEQALGVGFGLLSKKNHDLMYNLTWRTLTDPSQMAGASVRRQLGHSLISSLKYTSGTAIRKHADDQDGNGNGAASDVSSQSSSSSDAPPQDPRFDMDKLSEHSDISEMESERQEEPDSDNHIDYKSRLIIVYVEDEDNNNQLTEKARFRLSECFGYFTFAREIQCLYDTEFYPLAHVSWPWAPRYLRAEYYAKDSMGIPFLLDPLDVNWDNFKYLVDYVVMKEKRDEEEATDDFILLKMFKGESLEVDVKFLRSVIRGAYKSLRKVLYLYCRAFATEDHVNWNCMPVDPWLRIGFGYFIGGDGVQLDYPEVSSEEEYDTDSSMAGTERSGDSDIIADVLGAGAMEIETQMDVQAGNNQGDNVWVEFLAKLVCVEIRLFADDSL